jgi:peptide/nickel transport system permease protein
VLGSLRRWNLSEAALPKGSIVINRELTFWDFKYYILGALAGYYGGRMDVLLSRLIEVMICFPTFFLIITIIAFLPPSIYNIMIAIGLTGWTGVARLIRGEFLKIRQIAYVEAEKALGAKDLRIIFRHMVPNAIAPVLVSATIGIASAILTESALSFLGYAHRD